jgi:2'-5' RNA ligase
MAEAGRPEGTSATLRLFIALALPEAWLAELGRIQEELGRAGQRLRYVRPEGVHLTLKFLGEVPASRRAAIEAAMERAAAGQPPLRLMLGETGTFGPERRPRVVWVSVAGDLAALGRLQRAVEEQFAPLGFLPEGRPFRPHLTLARVPETLTPEEAARIVPALRRLKPAALSFRAVQLALMRSALGADGARYTELRAAPLSEHLPEDASGAR